MATGNWYIYATTNAQSVFTKVWVAQGIGSNNDNAIAGPYPSEAAAKQSAAGILGTQGLSGWRGDVAVLSGALGYAVGGSGGLDTGVAAGESLGGLNLGEWFLRIGEIVLGIVLIGVGVAKLSGASNVVSEAAKTAGSVAML